MEHRLGFGDRFYSLELLSPVSTTILLPVSQMQIHIYSLSVYIYNSFFLMMKIRRQISNQFPKKEKEKKKVV